MIRVVMIDDHKLILHGITEMLKLSDDIEVIGAFNESHKLLDFLEEDIPDVLLLDINLPDINGLEVCKIVTEKYPSIKILALTNYEEISFVKNMIRSGAKGYLLKNCGQEELILSIKEVINGKIYLPKEIQDQLFHEKQGIESNENTRKTKLTRREADVLNKIAEEKTNTEISDQLGISIKTVEVYRNNLMQKFGARNTAGLIKMAYSEGHIS